VTTSPIWGHAPAERTKTKFGIRGRMADVMICFKFYRNRLRGFWAVRGQKWGFPIDFDCRPYNRSAVHYRAACDNMLDGTFIGEVWQVKFRCSDV